MNTFAGRADLLAAAIHSEQHEAVRHVLYLNAWKIKNWSDYASWKKHGRRFVAAAWHLKCQFAAADAIRGDFQEA